ncbi:MAG: hypothetical protein JWP66_269 [Naasia sp.]|nr:hypothetical protein [Naasia sp.]
MTDSGSGGWESPGGRQSPDRDAPRPQPRYGEYAPAGAAPPPPPLAQAAWTPPPKPGLVPLRPLGFGTLLLAPFQLLRKTPGLIGVAILLQFAVLVVGGVLAAAVIFGGFARITDWEDPDQQSLIAGSIAGGVLGSLALVAFSFVISAFLQGIVVEIVARASLGVVPTVRAAWQRVKPRLGPLVLWTVLVGVAVFVILLILTGVVLIGVALGPVGIAVSIGVAILLGLGALALWIWIATKLSLVPSVLVLEGGKLRAAISRSWRLTDANFWRTLGAQFLVAAIVNIVAQITTTPISVLGGLAPALIDPNMTGSGVAVLVITQIVIYALATVIGAISVIVTSTVAALLYLDLRMRKEGLDLVLQRHVEGGGTGDPFTPGGA